MILFWVIVLLHQGYTMVPVTTVHLGDPATFTCAMPNKEWNSRVLHWYKQSAGDTLKWIVTLYKSTKPQYAPDFSESRFEVNHNYSFFNLTIQKTIQEDEGMYHCGISEWINTEWSGTYLLVKGNPQRSSNYTVIQSPSPSDPVRPGDLMNLQCSVLSDSENKTCSGDYSVYWFRAGSYESHPDIIYTDGNTHDECDKRSDTQKRCVHRFSKTISSSDAGTYYCAVATCGEILFGNGAKVEVVQTTFYIFTAMAILIVCLGISVVGNIVLICKRKVKERYKATEIATSEERHQNLSQQVHDVTEGEEELNYAALNFSVKKTRGRKKRDFAEESLYSQVEH